MVPIIDFEKLAVSPPEDAFRVLKSSPKGLTLREARQKLRVYGPNEVHPRQKLRLVRMFLSKFKNPLVLMLLVAATLSGILGSPINAVIIGVIVLGSTMVDVTNAYRSDKTAEALQERVHLTAAVLRNSKVVECPLRTVVPGDVCELFAGDIVPGDGIVFEGKDLFINESVLTGESMPVEKNPAHETQQVLFMGTSVVSGKARMLVLRTGLSTRTGLIAEHLVEEEILTNFDEDIKKFSGFLFQMALAIVSAVVVIHLIFGSNDTLQVLLFAITIAVGITPELLPAVITANLSRGAFNIAKQGAIVRRLSSLHNLGSIDMLCVDKTGTLTEDHIALIEYVDGEGSRDENVLFWGALNGLYHTGIRGALDEAIHHFHKIDPLGWEKIDEVPFDFERRRDSIVVGQGEKRVLITKGAPEDVLKAADTYGAYGVKFNASLRARVEKEYARLSGEGFRVLGVAIKQVPVKKSYDYLDEQELTFLGFLAFLDPPKPGAKAAIQKMEDHHVTIKIITGDNQLVTKKIAEEIGLPFGRIVLGDEVAKMTERELGEIVDEVSIFARVFPEDKERIIKALRANGHVVGYLGDGVNDVLSLRAADVGISVNNAVDIAKATADIILLRRGLDEIMNAVIEGRKTFANLFTYLMTTLSSNFGNMLSMPIGSLFLPFLPMLPSQVLLNNFLYDSSQLAIPFDNVDSRFLTRPKRFDIAFMKRFMFVFGPLSSLFDFATFAMLLGVLHVTMAGFQTAWFLESIATQTLVIRVIRSRAGERTGPSRIVVAASSLAVIVGWLLPYMPFGKWLGFTPLPFLTMILIAVIVALYLVAVSLVKPLFYKKWGSLIEK